MGIGYKSSTRHRFALVRQALPCKTNMMASTDYQALDGYDVIIVGAGISGCSAAWYLKQHGRSALILEANDRSGGKTYTVPDGCGKAGHVDLGASWVNDTTQSYINALIEEFGLERVIQNREGLFLTQQPDGTFFTHTYHDKVVRAPSLYHRSTTR